MSASPHRIHEFNLYVTVSVPIAALISFFDLRQLLYDPAGFFIYGAGGEKEGRSNSSRSLKPQA